MNVEAVIVDARERARAFWVGLSRERRATVVALLAMIVGGVVLRCWNIGFPPRFTFDEHHFIPNARHYIVGDPDDNDHPPLGKLFIAISILTFGDNPTGWRAASLIFGLQTIVVAAALARELFEDRRAGWFAAAFFAADGFFLAYSRTALLDGSLACLVLWSVLAAVTARTWRGVLVSAALVGLAASVKWNGGFAVIPAALAVWQMRRAPRWTILLFGFAAVVHLGLWFAALPLSGQPASLHVLFKTVWDLVKHHVELGHRTNPLASSWWTWPLLVHPIVVKLADRGASKFYSASVGNPLLFVSATLAVLIAFVGAPLARVNAKVRARLEPLADPVLVRAAIVLAGGWFALMAPWILGRGTYTFWYHYLPPYGLALVLVAGTIAHLERRFERDVATYVLVALALLIFFAPVWGEFRISEGSANDRLIFPGWKP
ncbi:MAG TPA: phospholipid carrier-dependent glycosyltransferase [Polyangia bacterium]|nr:phospholipid carrier-dependent glycosyltransferase [Polyangia bacterium]